VPIEVILAEPPRSQYDVHFVLAGIPVRIHPMFWLISLLLVLRRASGPIEGGLSPGAIVIIWIVSVFVSILVHEMGHAFAIRYFGWEPRVVLYSLGGLAIWDSNQSYGYGYERRDDTPWAKIFIAAAGPAAGFVLAALVVGLCLATGHAVTFSGGGPLGFDWNVQGIRNLKVVELIDDLLYANIYWGLVNLLPVFPLDGGQISRELFSLYSRHDGVARSLLLSAIIGGIVAVLALVRLGVSNGLFPAVMFGYLAYISYATLQAYRGGGYGDYGERDDRGW
jgi:Zn-dependent protease